MSTDAPRNFLLYDGDCPFCARYMEKLRLERALAGFAMMNARDVPRLVQEVRNAGHDINTGMILSVDGNFYHGPECMRRLALMSTGSSWFNTLSALAFSRPRTARLVYPLLVGGRNLTLFLLGRRLIGRARHDDTRPGR